MIKQNPERSSFIFTLAEEVGISLKPGEDCIIEDETYFAYRERYKAWVIERDKALRLHLTYTKPTFRICLPYRNRAFRLAYQILWYMDEVVIRDPIGEAIFLADIKNNLERSKEQLRTMLQFLSHFRSGIELGYLLLGGFRAISPGNEQPSLAIKEFLASQPDICTLLEREARFRMLRREDLQGQEWLFTQIELDAAMKMTFHRTQEGKDGLHATPPWIPGETIPKCTVEEMARATKKDVRDIVAEVHELIPSAVKSILQQAATAVENGAAILFDRTVDSIILNAAVAAGSTAPNAKKQLPTATAFNLSLPYLEGVPPHLLLDLRNELPQHFNEVRSRLADIVSRAAQADPEHVAEQARLIADRELGPALRNLGTEMEVASKRAKILGLIPSAFVATGMLLGYHYDLPAAWLATTALTGLGFGSAGLSSMAATYASDTMNATKNPFYFLWQARKLSR